MTPVRVRRRRNDRGVVLVEFALVVPVITMLLFGMAELGMAFRDKSNVTSAVRAGVRVGSSDRNTRLADYDVLQAVRTATVGITVDYVVIYKANADQTGALPTGCASMVAQSGVCSVYTGTQMQTLTAANFVSPTCLNEPDVNWCPTTHAVDLATGRDYIGVYVRAHRTWMSGEMPGTGVSFGERGVMQLEPGG